MIHNLYILSQDREWDWDLPVLPKVHHQFFAFNDVRALSSCCWAAQLYKALSVSLYSSVLLIVIVISVDAANYLGDRELFEVRCSRSLRYRE